MREVIRLRAAAFNHPASNEGVDDVAPKRDPGDAAPAEEGFVARHEMRHHLKGKDPENDAVSDGGDDPRQVRRNPVGDGFGDEHPAKGVGDQAGQEMNQRPSMFDRLTYDDLHDAASKQRRGEFCVASQRGKRLTKHIESDGGGRSGQQ